MAEQKDIRPPELESALFEFYAGPQPDVAFAARLEEQLRRRQTESILPERPTHVSLWASRRSLMKTLRARPLLALLVAVLAVLVLTGVVYAIGRLAGFIPGVGFVEDVQSVLEEPVVVTREILAPTENNGSQGAGLSVGAGGLATQNRDGITITVKEAVAEADRLVVVYTASRLPADLFSRNPEQTQPAEEPQPDQVRLPDGTVLSFHSGSGCQGWGDGVQTEVTCRLEFPPLPAGVQTFTLEIQRLTNARPGELPENWQIPVRLAPVSPTQMAGGVEEPGLSSSAVEGIRLLLIKAAQTPAQTAFQLGVQWEGQQRMVHHTGPVTLQDAQGRYYLLSGGPEGGRYSVDEPNFSTLSSLVTTRLAAGQPVTFRLDWIIMSAFGQNSLHFDPGANPQVGQEWTLNQEVEAGGFSLRFTRARLKESPDGAQTLEFDIEAPKGVTGVNLFSNVDGAFSGESGYDRSRGILVSRITLAALPAQPIDLQLSEVLYRVDGPWEVTWTPAEMNLPALTPTPAPTRLAAPAPTPIRGEPLLLELQSLLEKAYADYQAGPGWVHQAFEVEQAEGVGTLDSGDLPEQPLHYRSEGWFRLDEQGYVRTRIYIRKSLEGEFISADVDEGVAHFSFPENRGGIGQDVYLEAPSYNLNLLSLWNGYLAQGGTMRQEQGTLDGQPCRLVQVRRPYDPPQVFSGEPAPVQADTYAAWMDESGRVLQTQYRMEYSDGSSRVKTTTRYLTLERVTALSAEAQALLDKIIMP